MKAIELQPFDLVYLVQLNKRQDEEPDDQPNLFPDDDLTETTQPVLITETRGKGAGVIAWEWYGDPSRYSCWASWGSNLNWLCPIPLTWERLAKNGFRQEQGVFFDEFKAEGWYILNLDDRGEIIRIGYNEPYSHLRIGNTSNDNCWLSISLYYVHEFQHLLRLLGFYDLANNFKL